MIRWKSVRTMIQTDSNTTSEARDDLLIRDSCWALPFY